MSVILYIGRVFGPWRVFGCTFVCVSVFVYQCVCACVHAFDVVTAGKNEARSCKTVQGTCKQKQDTGNQRGWGLIT